MLSPANGGAVLVGDGGRMIIRPDELSQLLGVSRCTIWRWVRESSNAQTDQARAELNRLAKD